jgi:ATP phosphoribosyltransferase
MAHPSGPEASQRVRIAVPSKGRLRESCLDLLSHAGYRVGSFKGTASASTDGIEFIEMRPRDAAAWLRAGRLDAAFISTDTALENEVEDYPSIDLGFSRSDLVLACRDDSSYESVRDLAGATVATHLPSWTTRWFESLGVKDVNVVAMGGALEGVCAVGMADAIVDLRETGASLVRNRMHVVEVAHSCQAIFSTTTDAPPVIADLQLRIEAALAARRTQYVMLHLPSDRVDALSGVFPGLAAPTVLPLSGRDDLVAAHIVVDRSDLWARLSDLRALGATGIVALPTDAIVE